MLRSPVLNTERTRVGLGALRVWNRHGFKGYIGIKGNISDVQT